jgi:hypothetical protein
VDEAGDEPLKQLALAEDDGGLVAGALGEIAESRGGLAHPDEIQKELGTTGKEEAGDGERRGESKRSGQDVYPDRSRFSSAVIAGTISVRSPITA